MQTFSRIEQIDQGGDTAANAHARPFARPFGGWTLPVPGRLKASNSWWARRVAARTARLAGQPDAPALVHLAHARYLLAGYGMEKDAAAAMRHLEQARKGWPAAEVTMGWLYLTGDASGVAQDLERAHKLLQTHAQHHADAALGLAMYHLLRAQLAGQGGTAVGAAGGVSGKGRGRGRGKYSGSPERAGRAGQGIILRARTLENHGVLALQWLDRAERLVQGLSGRELREMRAAGLPEKLMGVRAALDRMADADA